MTTETGTSPTDSRPAPDEWQHSHSDGQRAGHPLAETVQEWQVVLRCDWCHHPAGWMCHRHDPHGKRPDGDRGCPVAVAAARHEAASVERERRAAKAEALRDAAATLPPTTVVGPGWLEDRADEIEREASS